MKVFARNAETKIFDKFLASNKPEFMAVYGRRRVGKTFIVNNHFAKEKCLFFSVTGMKNGSFENQRHIFCKRIAEVFYDNIPIEVPDTWLKVFELLQQAIQSTSHKKIVIFLDELPWLNTPRSGLLDTIEYYWNQYWCHNPRIKLIVCGSLSSWIIKHIIDNVEGLYNRVTYRLEIQPLTLHQTKLYLKGRGITLTHRQLLAIYMAIGGIPLYLDQIQKGQSAAQIIDALCFCKQGLLFDEIHELFQSLFKESASYVKLTREIAKHRYGVTRAQLAKTFKDMAGGRLTENLNDLENAGYISSAIPYQHKSKGVYYKLNDEYILFYFSWIEPNIALIKRLQYANGLWPELMQGNAFSAWKGYTFETICLKHSQQIVKALNLSPASIPYGWKYIPSKKSTEDGAQIDLLFDRPDDAISLCEIKCTDEPFNLDKQTAKALQQKIQVFQRRTGTKKQLFTVIVSASGLKPTMYSEELIANVVTLDDLFDN